MRIAAAGERQSVDLRRDALLAAGVDERHLYQDKAVPAGRTIATGHAAAALLKIRKMGIS